MTKTPRTAVAISLFLALTSVWIPFLHLYWLNRTSFAVPLAMHLPLLMLVGGSVFGIAFLLQVLPPGKVRSFCSGFLLILSIVLWAEGSLFLGRFGFFTGAEPDWAANRHFLFLESGLLVGLLLVARRLKGRLVANAIWVTSLLSLASLAVLMPAYRTCHAQKSTHTRLLFSDAGIFDLSPVENVVLFIVDTYQSDVFAQILAENPTWKDKLDGFTYFPDATSGFPKTYLSVPNMLTGQAFDNSRPYRDYMQAAYLGASAPRILKQHGFDVRFKAFTWQPYLADPRVADNLKGVGGPFSAEERREFLQLCNLTLFRIAPYKLKPWVYNEDRFRIPLDVFSKPSGGAPYTLQPKDRVYSRDNDNFDLEFLDRFRTFLSAAADKPTFRVFHLEGAHAPLVLDKDLGLGPVRTIDRPSFKEQAEGVLKLLDLAFAKMRKAGLYDNSMIIVVGDHGGGEYPDVGLQYDSLAKLGIQEEKPAPCDPLTCEVVQGGIPLMLVKRLHRHGSLEIARNQVQLGDIPRAIRAELALGKPPHASPLFPGVPPQPRTRIHRYYRFAGWGQDFVVPMREFAINGFSWDPASWSPTGRDLNAQAAKALNGDLVVMGQGGNLNRYRHGGWGPPQIQGRFMADSLAFVDMPLDGLSEPVFLNLRVRGMYSPLEPLTMKIRVAGRWLADWTVSRNINIATNTLKVLIPEQFRRDRASIRVSFDLGDRKDDSPQFVEIRVESTDPDHWRYRLGRPVSLRAGGDGQPYLARGWGEPESGGTWSLGHEADVLLNLEPLPAGDLELEMDFSPAVFPAAPPLDFTLSANSLPLRTFHAFRLGKRTEKVSIPAAALGAEHFLQLSFTIANPRAPREYLDSTDPRELGISLIKMVVRPAEKEASVRAADLFENAVPDAEATVRKAGFWVPEDWAGVPVVWSRSSARLSWPLPTGQVPPQLELKIMQGSPVGSRLVVFANNTLVGDGRMSWFPCCRRVSLAQVAGGDSLVVNLYCDGFSPQGFRPGSGDQRELGMAFAAIRLVPPAEVLQQPDSTCALLPRPFCLDLGPGAGPERLWSGLHPSEKWGPDLIAWTGDKARCRTAWTAEHAPEHLLLDLAATAPAGTRLTVEINGVSVLADKEVRGQDLSLVDITGIAPADTLDVTLSCGTFVPAEVRPGSKDIRRLGVALRKFAIME